MFLVVYNLITRFHFRLPIHTDRVESMRGSHVINNIILIFYY
jgi:hypothetical protein